MSSEIERLANSVDSLTKTMMEFMVKQSNETTVNTTMVSNLVGEKTQLFTFVNAINKSLGLIKGMGLAFNVMCIVAMVYFASKSSEAVPLEKVKIEKEERKKDVQ